MGDNLDFFEEVRHQAIYNLNKEYHWFNVMAVKERIDFGKGINAINMHYYFRINNTLIGVTFAREIFVR